jgi:hypothetical protein
MSSPHQIAACQAHPWDVRQERVSPHPRVASAAVRASAQGRLKARGTPAWGNALGWLAPAPHRLDAVPTPVPGRHGLKARPIPAWGEAPCKPTPKFRGLKARPITSSIPQKLLVALHPILLQEGAKLILKRTLLVMRLLPIDVLHQRLQIGRPNRKRPIPSLPGELRQRGRLRLQPLRRCCLQLRNQLRDSRGPRQSNRKMNMVRRSTNAIALAPRIARNRREIAMKIASYSIVKKRPAPLGTEDQMHHNKRERQWHGQVYRPGLQPSTLTRDLSWGCAPCWYSVAPSALGIGSLYRTTTESLI